MLRRSKLPLIFQSELAECGLACFAMILGYYGCEVSLSSLRERFKITLKGLTLLQLNKISAEFNFDFKVLRIDIDQLSILRQPCILHWNRNHFVVLKEIKKQAIVVHDPARGLRLINANEINHAFTGIAIEITPNHLFTPALIKNKTSPILKKLFSQYGKMVCKIIVISLFIQCCYIFGIKTIQHCIDKLSTLNFHSLCFFIFLSFGLKLMEISAIALRATLIIISGAIINSKFGINLKKHLIGLPIAFFSNRHIGDIVSRFSTLDKIRMTFTDGLAEGIVDGMISSITLIALCCNNLKIGLLIMGFSILYIASRIYYQRYAKQFHEEALYLRATELSHFMETLRAIPSIQIFKKEDIRLKNWMTKFISSINATTKLVFYKSLYDFVKNFLQAIEFSITLILSFILIAQNKMTLGAFYAFLSFRQQFILSLNSCVVKMDDFKLLRLHVDRLNDIISITPQLSSTNKCTHKHFTKIKLCLENIAFRYESDTDFIFQGVNLNIQRGECVAITGPSGCGKTTLLKIMMGLLPPTDGHMYLNNISVYPDHAACFRKKIAAVLQDDVLLSGTIAENISFFDQDIDIKRIYECAEFAGIIDEIQKFPMGFETLIGDMGSVFSGGQKQRILLARALYVKPSILFLDESSSHLDNKKEYEINKALRSLNITIVMIAHRKESIKMADRIYEMTGFFNSC